jgi:hypothetical protein
VKIETAAHLSSLLRLETPYIQIRPRIIFSDGFSVSIQASSCHYCVPRNNIGPYTHFEIGFPSEIVDDWIPYCEGSAESEDPRQMVYPRVPLNLIVNELKLHGSAELIDNNFVFIPESLRSFQW